MKTISTEIIINSSTYKVRGILSGSILRKIEKATRAGFKEMNLALKEKAEKQNPV